MFDTYRVLPHRDIYVRYAAAGDTSKYEHKEANWCPHCAATINKAARRRGDQDRRS